MLLIIYLIYQFRTLPIQQQIKNTDVKWGIIILQIGQMGYNYLIE